MNGKMLLVQTYKEVEAEDLPKPCFRFNSSLVLRQTTMDR